MPTIGSFSQDDLFGQQGTLETSTFKARRSSRITAFSQASAKSAPPGRSHRRVAAPTFSSSSPHLWRALPDRREQIP
jgi:hypothetical protein